MLNTKIITAPITLENYLSLIGEINAKAGPRSEPVHLSGGRVTPDITFHKVQVLVSAGVNSVQSSTDKQLLEGSGLSRPYDKYLLTITLHIPVAPLFPKSKVLDVIFFELLRFEKEGNRLTPTNVMEWLQQLDPEYDPYPALRTVVLVEMDTMKSYVDVDKTSENKSRIAVRISEFRNTTEEEKGKMIAPYFQVVVREYARHANKDPLVLLVGFILKKEQQTLVQEFAWQRYLGRALADEYGPDAQEQVRSLLSELHIPDNKLSNIVRYYQDENYLG